MLTQLTVQRYKSLYDVTVDLEPLTVFIGPNGSGKSNICEALVVLSYLLDRMKQLFHVGENQYLELDQFHQSFSRLSNQVQVEAKFWQGNTGVPMSFGFVERTNSGIVQLGPIFIFDPKQVSREEKYILRVTAEILRALGRVALYDFSPTYLSELTTESFQSSGRGVANALTAILLDNRERFVELEQRFIQLVPNISRISLKRGGSSDILRLVDRFSEHLIPAADISDGTLRLLGFLAALYQIQPPDVLCFEEPENGVHPWLLHKMVELLNLVSTEGIGGKPVQVLITTHSPVLLNYVKPQQVRAVELDEEGRTQVYPLPTDSARFQKAMEAYDNALGELWFTNIFGGNPS
ncbi:MAG: ATP-binding protein [Chloroflexota bacterium]